MTNELQLNNGPYKTTFTGLEIQRESTKDEWITYGEVLRKVDEAKQWAIGDWLCDGKSHYGDGLYEKASEILCIDEGRLRQYKSNSDIMALCLRKHNVSWSHYYELNSLKKTSLGKEGKTVRSDEYDLEKAQEFLKKAEKDKMSVRELREAVSEYKRIQNEMMRMANEPDKYQVVYIDSPWEYNDKQNTDMLGGAEKHYPTMTLGEICALPIRELCCENSILFMWVTAPLLEDGFKVLNSWGFKYKTNFVWDKVKHNMGHYSSVRHEHLLIGTKGSCTPDNIKLFDSVQTIEKTGKHSEKPHEFYEIIETLYGGKKIELFARNKRDAWESWGNEV